MFTGIIQEVGRLKEKITADDKYQLVIEARKVLKNVDKGDSIAVNGICLTVVEFTDSYFRSDVMPETLRATNLSKLHQGSKVNLEQAVRADGFFGGHLVSGHIDGVGQLKKITPENNAHVLEIAVDPELTQYMIDRGSVAINGISLTVMKVYERTFTVSLIPETFKYTNLSELKIGDEINIETDLIGKYVFKMIKMAGEKKNTTSNIDENFLKENGF